MKEIIKVIILPAVIGLLGMYFTYTYNNAKLKSDYANTVYKYLPEFKSDNIVDAQIAFEILKPILTPEQEEVIKKVIEARQKIVIDKAVETDDESILDLVGEITKIDQKQGSELTNYTEAAITNREGFKLVASGEYEKAAEKFRLTANRHSDFKEVEKWAKLIDDKLVSQPFKEANEIEVLDSIISKRFQIPIKERKKILDRSDKLRLLKKTPSSERRK